MPHAKDALINLPSSIVGTSPTETTMHDDHAAFPANHALLADVIATSRHWITHFNHGDIDACADMYTEDAVMEASPFGTFNGREQIRAFWRALVEDKRAGLLRYSAIKVEQSGPDEILLSADWTMNIGGGRILLERWVRRNGRWRLAEDRFAVEGIKAEHG